MWRQFGRWRELWLLLLALTAFLIGTAQLRAVRGGDPFAFGPLELVIAGAFLALHLWLCVVVPRADQLLLPLVALLTGLGWLVVGRLEPDLARNQAIWILLGIGIAAATTAFGGNLAWLQRYKYTWAVAGLAAMAVTAIFARETYGARLWLSIGGVNVQPTELMKLLLVVFMAAYLADRRELLIRVSYRWGALRLPPLPYLLPLLVMWSLSLLMLIWQRDLGATLLMLATALAILFVATGKVSYLIGGAALFLLNVGLGYLAFGYVRGRLQTWLDPWADPQDAGYQIVQSLVAVASGGIFGTGLGLGQPEVIPASFTDFVFAAVAEELGLLGAGAVLVTYLALVGRGLHIALRQRNEFYQLTAFGLSAMLGLQTLIIVGGNLGVLPLTGITLPFMSYGGSSITANFLGLGLLLRISALVWGAAPAGAARPAAATRLPTARSAPGRRG